MLSNVYPFAKEGKTFKSSKKAFQKSFFVIEKNFFPFNQKRASIEALKISEEVEYL